MYRRCRGGELAGAVAPLLAAANDAPAAIAELITFGARSSREILLRAYS